MLSCRWLSEWRMESGKKCEVRKDVGRRSRPHAAFACGHKLWCWQRVEQRRPAKTYIRCILGSQRSYQATKQDLDIANLTVCLVEDPVAVTVLSLASYLRVASSTNIIRGYSLRRHYHRRSPPLLHRHFRQYRRLLLIFVICIFLMPVRLLALRVIFLFHIRRSS